MTGSHEPQAHGREYARAMAVNWVAQILFTASIFLMLVLPRILQEQGIALGWHGWVMATFSAAFVGGVVSGSAVIGRYGHRGPAVTGCLAAAAGCLVQLAGREWLPAHFIGRAMHGLGCGWVFLALQSRPAALAPVHLRGQAIGVANLPGFLTLALSPWIAETLARSGLADGVFLVAGGICVALVLVARTAPGRTSPAAVAAAGPATSDRLNRPEWLALWFCFSQGLVVEFAKVLLPLVTAATAGWCFTGFFVAYGLVAFAARVGLENRLRVRLSPVVLIGTGALASLGVCVLAVASTVLAFALIGCLFGLSHGLFFPSLVQLITHRAGAGHLVGRLSKINAISATGAILGQIAAGLCAQRLGLRSALVWGGLLLAGGQGLLLVALWRASLFLREPAVNDGKANG